MHQKMFIVIHTARDRAEKQSRHSLEVGYGGLKMGTKARRGD
jgi:hypothetical protein